MFDRGIFVIGSLSHIMAAYLYRISVIFHHSCLYDRKGTGQI